MKNLVQFEKFESKPLNESFDGNMEHMGLVLEFLKKEIEAGRLSKDTPINEALELYEGFFNKLKDKLTGTKEFVLKKFKPSKDAEAYVGANGKKPHPSSKVVVNALIKFGKLSEETAKKAAEAVYDFFGGVPMLDKVKWSYDKNTDTLVLNPNKGGKLFSGNPVALNT